MGSSPATSALPEMRPPWNWGTRPSKSRSSVDLPPPELPATSVSPGPICKVTSRSEGATTPGYQYEMPSRRAIGTAMSAPPGRRRRQHEATHDEQRVDRRKVERRVWVPVHGHTREPGTDEQHG